MPVNPPAARANSKTAGNQNLRSRCAGAVREVRQRLPWENMISTLNQEILQPYEFRPRY